MRDTRPARTRMTTRDDRQHIFGRSPPSDMRMPHFEKTQIARKKLNMVAEVFSKLPFCIILFGFFENTFDKNRGFAAIEHAPP